MNSKAFLNSIYMQLFILNTFAQMTCKLLSQLWSVVESLWFVQQGFERLKNLQFFAAIEKSNFALLMKLKLFFWFFVYSSAWLLSDGA